MKPTAPAIDIDADISTRRISRRAVVKGALGFELALVLTDLERRASILVNTSRAGDAPPWPDLPDSPAVLAQGGSDSVAIGAWIKVDPDDSVTITVSKSEMGQGVRTSLAMIVAEELDADWSKVRVVQAKADPIYGNQGTVGSSSVSSMYTPLRQAGGTARAMLVAAAAQAWGVAAEACTTEPGVVVHAASGRRSTYGALASAAARQSVPPAGQVKLKDPSAFRIIGKPTGRVDNADVVTGKAVYGIDVRLPGMLHAVVARCPVFGGRVGTVDDAAARAVPGVRHVARIPSGVAVVADNTWAAIEGRKALRITWNEGANANLDSAQIAQSLDGAVGAFPAMPAGAAKTVEARYNVPYLAHATMEPMNCVADVRADRCVVYAPTQSPSGAQQSAAQALGRQQSAIEVNVTLMGGGFGRRAGNDYVTEAVQISQAAGAPVQLTWTRDDDMQHDYYRPASVHAFRGGLDGAGKMVAWQHQGAMAGGGGQGRPPYDVPQPAVNLASPRLAVPTGAWRSVANSQIVFANECFVDELAVAAGQDPFEFRRAHLSGNRRLRGVLELAAEKAGWSTTSLPRGHGRGIACMAGFGSYIAEVVEVSVAADGRVRVHRVVAAVDCGVAVNPRSVEAQVQGAIVDGLSTALKSAITIKNGRVEQADFFDYQWFHMGDMPLIEVHIVPGASGTGGIGEVGYPATAPAVLNAIFAATGKRARRLPVAPSDVATGVEPTPVATTAPTRVPATPTAVPPTAAPPTATPGTPDHTARVFLPMAGKE